MACFQTLGFSPSATALLLLLLLLKPQLPRPLLTSADSLGRKNRRTAEPWSGTSPGVAEGSRKAPRPTFQAEIANSISLHTSCPERPQAGLTTGGRLPLDNSPHLHGEGHMTRHVSCFATVITHPGVSRISKCPVIQSHKPSKHPGSSSQELGIQDASLIGSLH